MDIQDPTGRLTPIVIAKFCGAKGLPAPQQVVFQGSRGRHAIYAMVFQPQSGMKPVAMWTELATGVRGSALQIEAAALQALELAEGLEANSPFTIPPNYDLGWWAAVRPAIRSANGSQWVTERPHDWPGLGKILGQKITSLQDTAFPTFGFSADGGRFLPTRASWREEWRAYVDALSERAVATGVDMGPIRERLITEINARMDSLTDDCDWSLVHGNVGPQCLELIPHGANRPSVFLTQWDDAFIGDPIAESGALLGLAPIQLAAVFRGLDPEIIQEWLQPDSLPKVELYHFTWILNQLATIGDFYAFDRNIGRLANLSRIRKHIHESLQPNFCQHRIEQALALSGDEKHPWQQTSFDIIEGQLQIALGSLASNPSIPANQSLVAAASMGASLLAYQMDDDKPHLIQGCLAIASGTQTLKQGQPQADDTPIDDFNAWRDALCQELDQTLSKKMCDASSIVAWWTSLEAIQRVNQEVSVATLRGTERLIRGALHLASLHQNKSQDPLARRLTYAILGLGAIHGLRRLLADKTAFSKLQDLYRETLDEAALDIDLAQPATMRDDWTHEEIMVCLQQQQEDLKAQAVRPLLAYAFMSMHGLESLPNGPQWVCDHIGL